MAKTKAEQAAEKFADEYNSHVEYDGRSKKGNNIMIASFGKKKFLFFKNNTRVEDTKGNFLRQETRLVVGPELDDDNV